MPQDELERHHFQGMKTLIEVAADSHPKGSYEAIQQENAFAGLNILLQHYPEFNPLNKEDQVLLADVTEGMKTRVYDKMMMDCILTRLETRLRSV
jgi:hypothetical protein